MLAITIIILVAVFIPDDISKELGRRLCWERKEQVVRDKDGNEVCTISRIKYY